MTSALRRIGNVIARSVEAAFGFLGGLVCAFAGCLVAVYMYRMLGYPLMILLGVCLLSVLGFGLLGLLKPGYFGCFFAPLFSAFAGDGAQFRDDDARWGFAAMISLFVALLSLLIGALFLLHVAAVFGVLAFVAYAAFAPSIYAADNAESAPPNGGPATPSVNSGGAEGPPSVS